MFLCFFVLRGYTEAGRRDELPLVSRNGCGAENLVQIQDAYMYCRVVKTKLLSNIAEPINEVSAVREIGSFGAVGCWGNKVHLTFLHVFVQILRVQIDFTINFLLRDTTIGTTIRSKIDGHIKRLALDRF